MKANGLLVTVVLVNLFKKVVVRNLGQFRAPIAVFGGTSGSFLHIYPKYEKINAIFQCSLYIPSINLILFCADIKHSMIAIYQIILVYHIWALKTDYFD